MSAIGGAGWTGRATGWAIPAQAEGEVDGLCFYYRNRGGDESFSVGKTADEAVGAYMMRGSTAYYMRGDAEEWCNTDRALPFEAWLQHRIECFIAWFRTRCTTLGLELLRRTPDGSWKLRLRPECGGQDLWEHRLIDVHFHADGSHCLAKALYALLPRERQLRYLRRRTARVAGRPGVRVVLPEEAGR